MLVNVVPHTDGVVMTEIEILTTDIMIGGTRLSDAFCEAGCLSTEMDQSLTKSLF